MNMFDFAIKMEKDVEQLYSDLAAKAATEGVKKIFTMLAEDEKKHLQAIEILKRKNEGKQLDDAFIPEATLIFEEMRNNIEEIELSKDQLDDYKLALDIEKKGFAFFKEQFGKSDSKETKALFKCIANQELYHVKTIENLIDMLERPRWWVENAEFTPRDEDYI